MATPNAGVLDTVLNTFRTQIDAGYGALQGPVAGTLGSLIVISVVLMALFWALDENGYIWSPLIRKGMVVGWWSYLILNWQNLAVNVVFTQFGALGAQVGNAGGIAGFLNSPSQIVALGIGDGKVLLDLAAYYLGVKNQWGTPPVLQPVGLDISAAFMVIFSSLINAAEAFFAAMLVFIAFFWLALEIVVATIEFHIVILMGFCVLPFGVFEKTANYATRALSYVVSAGFKVMALGVIIGLSQNFLVNYQMTYTPGSLPGLDQMGGLALGILVILMLAISAPKYAQAIVSGSPSTGVGNLAGAAGLAAGAGLAVLGGAKAVVQGAPGAAKGAASIASQVRNGTLLGGSGSGSGAGGSGGGGGGSGGGGSGGGSGGSPGSPGGGGAIPANDTAGLAATIAPSSGSDATYSRAPDGPGPADEHTAAAQAAFPTAAADDAGLVAVADYHRQAASAGPDTSSSTAGLAQTIAAPVPKSPPATSNKPTRPAFNRQFVKEARRAAVEATETGDAALAATLEESEPG